MGLIHVVTAENGMIRFPHLGIVLNYVAKAFSVGSLEIACYGIVLAAAMDGASACDEGRGPHRAEG